MNILTDLHKHRNSLRIARESLSGDARQYCSLRAADQSIGFSGTSNSMMFDSSNFRTKRSLPPLSNQLNSGSDGPTPIQGSEPMVRHIPIMSQNPGSGESEKVDQIQCSSHKLANRALGKRSCGQAQVRRPFPDYKQVMCRLGFPSQTAELKRVKSKVPAMFSRKETIAINPIFESSERPGRTEFNRVGPDTQYDSNLNKWVVCYLIMEVKCSSRPSQSYFWKSAELSLKLRRETRSGFMTSSSPICTVCST